MPRDEEKKNKNIIKPNKALLFLSWDTQKPVTSPMEPPEELVWSDDSEYCIMAYSDTVCVYSIEEGLKLKNTYHCKSRHLKIIKNPNLGDESSQNILFIVTDTEIYATIISDEESPLFLISNSHQFKLDTEINKGNLRLLILYRKRGSKGRI